MPSITAKPKARLTVRKPPWVPLLSTICATEPQPKSWKTRTDWNYPLWFTPGPAADRHSWLLCLHLHGPLQHTHNSKLQHSAAEKSQGKPASWLVNWMHDQKKVKDTSAHTSHLQETGQLCQTSKCMVAKGRHCSDKGPKLLAVKKG